MGRKLFRSCLPGTSSNGDYLTTPGGVNSMSKQLQSCNRIFDQEQTIFHCFQLCIARYAISSRDSCDSAARKCSGDELMTIRKLAIKTSADVVFLRQRKEKFARAHRTRVNRKVINLFVKY